jgi:acyl-CoA thioesterase YciA
VRGYARSMSTRGELAIKVILLPKDTNSLGTIFGGVILSHVDLAATVAARKVAPLRFVTRAMNAVEFRQPVYVGDIVSFYTETVRVGRSSVTVRVLVEADRFCQGCEERVRVTEAEVVLVAVDERGVKRAILEP